MSQENSPADVYGPGGRRRRARVACEPCRERKRRCNGQLPCTMCSRFEYDCHYASRRRGTTQGRAPPDALPSGHKPPGGRVRSPILEQQTPPTRSAAESLEANSGAAFVRRLGLNIDPANAPRLQLFAWNTGDRLGPSSWPPAGGFRPITALISRETMLGLAATYFAKVAVGYSFMDRDVFHDRLEARWARGSHADDDYDQVLCGVAALGLHFSTPDPPPVERDLTATARCILERGAAEPAVSIDTVTGWVLRVAYLRMTSTPHVTWMASCTLMHVVEAAGVHRETPLRTVFDEAPSAVDVETRRRLWAMAQHLNTWASFDLGRSRVTLPGASTQPVTPREDDSASRLLGLLPLTEKLDPSRGARPVEDLEADLARLLADAERHPPGIDEPPAVMARVNLGLCIFRRLRAQDGAAAQAHVDEMLSLSRHGLAAARAMAEGYLPWHHAANNPFQLVCLLLAVDTRASLAMVRDALSALRAAADVWPGPLLREAYDAACLLTLLHQRRRDEDARELGRALDAHAPSAAAAAAAAQGEGGGVWLDDLLDSVPGLREFDLEQFLAQDLGGDGW